MKTINGDLLKIESGTLIHQVNCIGCTGGLAGALRRKWPDAFKRYDALCREAEAENTRPLLGCFNYTKVGIRNPNLAIVHIFGQVYPGPNTSLGAVRAALKDFSEWRAEGKDTGPIYAPYKMGCGLGGGNWDEYSALLEEIIPDIIIVRKEGFE